MSCWSSNIADLGLICGRIQRCNHGCTSATGVEIALEPQVNISSMRVQFLPSSSTTHNTHTHSAMNPPAESLPIQAVQLQMMAVPTGHPIDEERSVVTRLCPHLRFGADVLQKYRERSHSRRSSCVSRTHHIHHVHAPHPQVSHRGPHFETVDGPLVEVRPRRIHDWRTRRSWLLGLPLLQVDEDQIRAGVIGRVIP
jgi:hypothetical protein